MPLSPNQLKTPNRPIGGRNYMSYLERSFASPVERADEVDQWWEIDAVATLFDRAGRKQSAAGSPVYFMKAAAQGVVHLPSDKKVGHWERLLAAGGKKWTREGATWMSVWSQDPQLLLWGLRQGYDPFMNAGHSHRGSSCWESVLRRLGENGASLEDVQFFAEANAPERLKTLRPEQLADMFSLLCWQVRGHHQELLETIAQQVLAAGADPQRSFDHWAFRLTEKTLPWSDWLIPQAQPSVLSTDGLSNLMTIPGGLAVAQQLWETEVNPFSFNTFRPMGSNETVISSPWFDLLKDARRTDSAWKWSMALFDAMENGKTSPPEVSWLRALLSDVGSSFKPGWENNKDSNVWKEWLLRMPSWDTPGSNLGYAWLQAIAKPLAGLTGWEEKTDKLTRLLPEAALESPWLILPRFSADSSIQSFWSNTIVSSPAQALEFGASHPGTMGVLSWQALIDMKGLRHWTRWEGQSIQTLVALGKGSAPLLDIATFMSAASRGSAKLMDLLLEDGAKPCDSSALWETVRNNRDAWKAAEVLELVKSWQTHCPDQPLFRQPVDQEHLWKVVYQDFRASPQTIHGLLDAGVGLPSLDQLWGAPRGEGNELLRTLVRSQELEQALPAIAREVGAFKPRF